MRVDAESARASHDAMHRLAERPGTHAPLIVLVVALALGAGMCVRVHRTAAQPNAAPGAGSAQALAPSTAPEPPRR